MVALSQADALNLDKVACQYDSTTIFSDISFALGQSELACLLGPSGSGKTTLLRAICGLHGIDKGRIICFGEVFSRPGAQLLPEKRKMGMVFQDLALFPHMTVSENIAIGFAKRTQDSLSQVNEWLQRMDLTEHGNRYPHELSGGQQQRVALARAMIVKPRLMLLDEPFSNLDFDLRASLVFEMRQLLKQHGMAAILVTHDQRDAFGFADKVGLLDNQRLQQWDTPYNLYHMPATRLVADFIGDGVFIPGTLVGEQEILCDFGVLYSKKTLHKKPHSQVEVLIRPDDVVHDPHSAFRAEVCKKTFMGPSILYELQMSSGTKILSMLPSHQHYALGDHVGINFEIEHMIIFDRDEAI